MAEIIPAILPQKFEELEDKMGIMKGLTDVVQIDICDGIFTPEKTWPFKKQDANYVAILEEERGMPFWEELDFEAHLMIKNPEVTALEWVAAGASRIIAHVESTNDFSTFINELKDIVEIGVALNVDTPLETIKPYIDEVNFVQFMGIKNVGYQGQGFDESVLIKISQLRKDYPDIIISVDGGVNKETAPKIIEAGADRLVIGSAIFNSNNFVQAIQDFQNL